MNSIMKQIFNNTQTTKTFINYTTIRFSTIHWTCFKWKIFVRSCNSLTAWENLMYIGSAKVIFYFRHLLMINFFVWIIHFRFSSKHVFERNNKNNKWKTIFNILIKKYSHYTTLSNHFLETFHFTLSAQCCESRYTA